ncbi:MAP/microtubule affinity-regulating kinase 3 [Wickerhamomyces ciferrii]|uniref:non-specific serine/threonine protein kinase n=1 Tax=Wickerhamomyces ciferrii (strain ATCC 14091 / BCRC 22168 / CBS 111 / JCM 3599 / NBRC 0793 / NRRL Y-1031 F-60-10) TaxID=1206466 RepID=K0KRN4_WICCF|nr:MAP/microtubule affinity-regulating kinase 3 [Wickerhamomyces ciferrii]CCH43979.1 MAP/microtubule affinity-regulating kinase 3 [Wickerhamomyces ciferrii]
MSAPTQIPIAPNPDIPQQHQAQQVQAASRKRSVQDFQFGNRIGEGSYSTVFKATDIQNKKLYAIKVLSKKHIVKEKKIKYVNIEKTTLNRLGRHPGIVTLYYTFQDDASLYFVIDIAEYGELLTIIRKLGSLSEDCSKYYMKQIIDAVDFMHSKGIIHRDLKPENILVNTDMKIMITDFGAAKILDLDPQGNIIDKSSTNDESLDKGSFVGTAEYVSPELLKFNKCGFECDLWAIGCIIYQFFVGLPPFKGKTEFLTFEKIVNLQYQWPNYYIPSTVKNLVDNLLKLEPKERLTIKQVESHNWFGNFNWDDKNLIWLTQPPKLEPYQSIIQQHNENSQNFKKIIIQKKIPTATAKKKLLNNTLKQIKNENGSYIYSPLNNGNGGQPSTNQLPQQKPIYSQPQVPPQFIPSPQKRSPNSPGFIGQRSTSQQHLSPKVFNPQLPRQTSQPVISKIPSGQQQPPPHVNPTLQYQQSPQKPPLTTQPFRPQQSYQSSTVPPPPPSVNAPPPPQQQQQKAQSQQVPSYIQNIQKQPPPQIRNTTSSASSSPKLAPPLVPTSSQIKPQHIIPPSNYRTQPPPKILTQSPRSLGNSSNSIPNSPNGSNLNSPKSSNNLQKSNSSVVSSPKSPQRRQKTTLKLPLVISNELAMDETVIKLDYINESELIYSSLYTMDPTNPLSALNKNSGLDDVLINEIITRNESQLISNTKRIVMVITDYGNLYLFKNDPITEIQKYLKIDLTDKFFAMYDYEFNEFKQSGFLILEITKLDKLIFLSPLSNQVKLDLQDISSIQIGLEFSWIEALLKTKELLKSKPSSPAITNNSKPSSPALTNSSSINNISNSNTPISSSSSQSKPKPIKKNSPTSTTTPPIKSSNGHNLNGNNNGTKTMSKASSKPPQVKVPRRPSSQSTPTTASQQSNQQKIQQQNKKFAGGAAAAAFNAASR